MHRVRSSRSSSQPADIRCQNRQECHCHRLRRAIKEASSHRVSQTITCAASFAVPMT